MIRVLVSACLLGERVRYDGADAVCASDILAKWSAENRLVSFCPEVAGGLGVPRPAAEIAGGDGRMVLSGSSPIVTGAGDDVTMQFLRGAELALETAARENIRVAVLKDGSPSCGSTYVYDGSFSRSKRGGQGVTTALLEKNGVRVFSERQLDEAADYVAGLEREASKL